MTAESADRNGTRRVIEPADFPNLVGQELGRSAWHVITQTQIDRFADATGDHAWMHVDPERAKTSPFGGTIAHGFLTLSLVPALTEEAFTVAGDSMLVNYGVNRVRFPAPLKVDSRLRLTTRLNGIETSASGLRLALGFQIDIEGGERPAAVGETVLLVAKGNGA
jgi:acyl dehydratase